MNKPAHPQRRSRIVATLALLNLLVATNVAQEPQRITPPGINSYAFDVNDSGLVVGFVADDNHRHVAAAWDATNQPITLQAIGAVSAAVAVNGQGLAVGWSNDLVTLDRPVRWSISDGGTATELPHFGNGGRALDVNEAGEIVGFVVNPTNDSFWAAKWTADGQLQILKINGEPSPYSVGTALNERGDVAGTATLPSQSAVTGVWIDGEFTQIGSNDVIWATPFAFTNDRLVYGTGINASGNGTGVVRWNPDGTSQVLPPVDNTFTAQVFDANERGVAVGWSGFTVDPHRVQTRATIWRNGVPQALSQPENSDVTLYGINEGGTTVGVIKTGHEFYAARWVLDDGSSVILPPVGAAEPGDRVRLNAWLRGPADKSGHLITFRMDGRTVGSARTDAAGRATVSVSVPINAPAGTVTVQALLNQNVHQSRPMQVSLARTRIEPRDAVATSGDRRIVEARLVNDRRRTPLAGQSVRFRFGAQIFSATTDRNGVARVVIPGSVARATRSGRYAVIYSGNPGHRASSNSARL